MAERVLILIDGSNFYHRLRELQFGDLLRFDYRAFADFLAHNRTQAANRYYIGAVREEANNPTSRRLMRSQRLLTSSLQKHGWQVVYGHILKTGGVYHEKGVDVLMAVDLLAGAYEDTYDTAVLISSDTDLIPALDRARLKGKKVEYIGFSHKPSYGLIAHSDIRRLLTKQELEQFLLTE